MLKKINPFASFLESREQERIRHILAWLDKLPSGCTFLDAGAGNQPFRQHCEKQGLLYTSQDFGKYEGGEKWANINAIEWNGKDCDIICDITAIPVPNSSFDFILCTEVLEHIFKPHSAINELVRVLKPGGEMFVTVPFASIPHQLPYFYNSGLSVEWFNEVAAINNCKIDVRRIGDLGELILTYTIVKAASSRSTFSLIYYFMAGIQLFLLKIYPKLIKDDLAYRTLVVTFQKLLH